MKYVSRGFTLIELLVVVVIIGILASISVTTFFDYQRKARNAKREADISQIHKALILYDKLFGGIPSPGTYTINNPNHPDEMIPSKTFGWDSSYYDGFLPFLEDSDVYGSKVPVDPLNIIDTENGVDRFYSLGKKSFVYYYSCYVPPERGLRFPSFYLGYFVENKDGTRTAKSSGNGYTRVNRCDRSAPVPHQE